MTMNVRNILKLLQEAFNYPQYNIDSAINDDERAFASQLENIIKDSIDSALTFESYTTLCCEDNTALPETHAIEEDFHDDYNDIINDNKKVKTMIDFEYKEKAVQYWHSGKTGNLKFESVRSKFKKIQNITMLYRWEMQVKEGGTRNKKLLEISKYVMKQFQNAHLKSIPIHDIDIKRWALNARNEVKLPRELFTASSKWIHNFKIKHGIVSRKINKFTTQTLLSKKGDLVQEANQFVSKIREQISLLGADNVYNSDQSGFNYESHAGRTLSFKGTAKVECLTQSKNSLTHSYTIQPIVSASGLLKSPLFIVLQETGGQFGPVVEMNIYKAENIVVVPSKSGKLSSDLAVQWYKDIYLSVVDEQSVLCLDSWTGQTKKNFDNVYLEGKDVNIFTIPAGTTGMIQPLDVYGFRPWKNFLKHFSDLIILYGFDVNLHARNNVLKLQSLIHNQFSSARFVNMFKYAWYKSGYIQEKPPKCKTPVQYCFENCDISCKYCKDNAFIRCAWCTHYMCLIHFFDPNNESGPHYCKDYKE